MTSILSVTSLVFALLLMMAGRDSFKCFHASERCTSRLSMAMDQFITEKLNSIKRTYDALTERLSDPDLSSDRKQLLTISRESSSIEPTVQSYNSWVAVENERLSLVELDQDSGSDPEIRDMARGEIRYIASKQKVLEDSITLMLLSSTVSR